MFLKRPQDSAHRLMSTQIEVYSHLWFRMRIPLAKLDHSRIQSPVFAQKIDLRDSNGYFSSVYPGYSCRKTYAVCIMYRRKNALLVRSQLTNRLLRIMALLLAVSSIKILYVNVLVAVFGIV